MANDPSHRLSWRRASPKMASLADRTAAVEDGRMRRWIRSLACLAAMLASTAATPPGMDPDNPTCPANPNWSDYKKMVLTPFQRSGETVLLAEGRVDSGLPARLEQVLQDNPAISEIWIRSPGGDARAGNAAGLLIRKFSKDRQMVTRIPSGWTCFSACNFVFMGGRARTIDPGGHFMVHMFTMTSDQNAIQSSVALGAESTTELISDVEREAALLATEDNDLLIRLDVSRDLLSDIMYRQKAVATAEDRSTRRCLTMEEALRYNVVNVKPD